MNVIVGIVVDSIEEARVEYEKQEKGKEYITNVDLSKQIMDLQNQISELQKQLKNQ